VLAGNPWSELVSGKLNFWIAYDGLANSVPVRNRHPLPGDQQMPVFRQVREFLIAAQNHALP